MTLHDYITRAKAELDEMEAHWTDQNAKNGDSFPLEMGVADWEEQRAFFLESLDNN
jgi:hypothetical protein